MQYITTSPAGQGYTESNDYDSATGVLIGVGSDTTQLPNLAKVLYNNNALVDTIDYKTSGSGFLILLRYMVRLLSEHLYIICMV